MFKYILSAFLIISVILSSLLTAQTSAATATYQGERQNCNGLTGKSLFECVNSWNNTSTSNPITFDRDTGSQKQPLNQISQNKQTKNCEIINGQKICGSNIPDCLTYRIGCNPTKKTNNTKLNTKNTTRPSKQSELYKVSDPDLKKLLRGNTLIYGNNQFVQCIFEQTPVVCYYFRYGSTTYFPAKIYGDAVYIKKYSDIEKIYLKNFNQKQPKAIDNKHNKRQYLIPVLPESLPINFWN